MNMKFIGGMLVSLILFLTQITIALAQMGTISIKAREKTAYTIVYLSIAILIVLITILFMLRNLLFPKSVKPRITRGKSAETISIPLKPFYDKEQIRKEREERIRERKREVVVGHLKDDEKQIIEILKQRDGVCEQGTLKVITDFSKAKLSELLSELENRRIIIKKKKGRKNLIILAEA